MQTIFDKKREGGFTLIELLVVIAIIGTLASIVLVSMGAARAKARDAVRKADMRQIVSAMQMYYGDNNTFATSASALTSIGTYLTKMPTDPKSGAAYGWQSNAANDQKFCAYATLEQGGTNGYYTANQEGNFATTAAPTSIDMCR